jgi:hypothetical protein
VTTGLFNISGYSTGTFNVISGTVTLTGTNVVWQMETPGANITLSGANFIIQDTSAATKAFWGGGATYGNLTVDGAASNGAVTITDSNTFATMTWQPDSSIILQSGNTNTITTLVASGTSGHLVTLASSVGGNPATLALTNHADIDYISIQDNTVTSGDSIQDYAGTNSLNISGNTGWQFTPSAHISTSGHVTRYDLTGGFQMLDFGVPVVRIFPWTNNQNWILMESTFRLLMEDGTNMQQE